MNKLKNIVLEIIKTSALNLLIEICFLPRIYKLKIKKYIILKTEKPKKLLCFFF